MSAQPDSAPITAQDAIAVLNRVHEADPTVLTTLIAYRVPCNDAVADDPTVQVDGTVEPAVVGLLGMLNGIFGVGAGRSGGAGWISAHYDNRHRLSHFALTRGPDVV